MASPLKALSSPMTRTSATRLSMLDAYEVCSQGPHCATCPSKEECESEILLHSLAKIAAKNCPSVDWE